MAITRETLRLARELRVSVASITDARARVLVQAWVRAWDELAAALLAGVDDVVAGVPAGSTPTRTQIVHNRRLMAALDQALTQLKVLAAEAQIGVRGDVEAAARLAGQAQAGLITSQLPPTEAAVKARLDRFDPRTLDAIVQRTTQHVTALHYPLAANAYEAMLRELIRGVAVGDNPRESARRMLARVEGQFNGGLTRALVIARTEVIDAHRAAALAAQQANADVLAGWVWHCQLDTRSCPSCWSRHGTLHPVSEPGPLDHQQGRCSRTPQTKTWRELGFNIDEPPTLLPDAQATFRALPEADQVAVMGPARLAALQSGHASWADLSIRRRTFGWRDSYAPRPARDLAAQTK